MGKKNFKHSQVQNCQSKRRLIEYAERQAQNTTATTHALCEGVQKLSKANYRLLENESITTQDILLGCTTHTVELCQQARTVLAIEDTTELTYTRTEAKKLAHGTVPKIKTLRRLYQHSILAVDADTKETIGLLYAKHWERGKEKKDHTKELYENKESYKWQESSEKITSFFPPDEQAKLISVCDREADIYPYLQYKVENNQRFVVRATHNRSLQTPKENLFVACKKFPLIAVVEVHVPQSNKRQERTATVEVRASTVTIKKSKRYKKTTCFSLNVVYAKETGEAKNPLEWVLLTTENVETEEEVLRCLEYYRKRFVCEEFHKALKTGCKAEERKLRKGNMDRLLGILLAISIRILQLRDVTAREPEASCLRFFSEEERKCLESLEERRLEKANPTKKLRPKETKHSKPTPKKHQTMRWAMEQIAKLAGWQDTKGDGKIGWQKLWEGYEQFLDILQGWEMSKTSSA